MRSHCCQRSHLKSGLSQEIAFVYGELCKQGGRRNWQNPPSYQRLLLFATVLSAAIHARFHGDEYDSKFTHV